MKFINPRRFADPDAGARRLMKLANAFEPAHDGPTCVYGLWTLIPPAKSGIDGLSGWNRRAPRFHRSRLTLFESPDNCPAGVVGQHPIEFAPVRRMPDG